MPILTITLTIAGACALIAAWLGFRVGQMRGREKVMTGDGGNEAVMRRMRAQANFVEYAPFVLILMGLIEAAVGPSPWLWVAGIVFIVARLLHPFGMEPSGRMALRGAGIGGTLLVLIGLALWALTIPYLSDTVVVEEEVTVLG